MKSCFRCFFSGSSCVSRDLICLTSGSNRYEELSSGPWLLLWLPWTVHRSSLTYESTFLEAVRSHQTPWFCQLCHSITPQAQYVVQQHRCRHWLAFIMVSWARKFHFWRKTPVCQRNLALLDSCPCETLAQVLLKLCLVWKQLFPQWKAVPLSIRCGCQIQGI